MLMTKDCVGDWRRERPDEGPWMPNVGGEAVAGIGTLVSNVDEAGWSRTLKAHLFVPLCSLL